MLFTECCPCPEGDFINTWMTGMDSLEFKLQGKVKTDRLKKNIVETVV